MSPLSLIQTPSSSSKDNERQTKTHAGMRLPARFFCVSVYGAVFLRGAVFCGAVILCGAVFLRTRAAWSIYFPPWHKNKRRLFLLQCFWCGANFMNIVHVLWYTTTFWESATSATEAIVVILQIPYHVTGCGRIPRLCESIKSTNDKSISISPFTLILTSPSVSPTISSSVSSIREEPIRPIYESIC